jgi:thiosulfate reductase cytochrome b subunit
VTIIFLHLFADTEWLEDNTYNKLNNLSVLFVLVPLGLISGSLAWEYTMELYWRDEEFALDFDRQ